MNRHELLTQFLDRWPLDKVTSMTLEEYTDTNRNDSFCYWLERRTDPLGGITGGSSFKFGIYKSAADINDAPSKKVSTDGEYVWLNKYGNSKDEAFDKVKNIIINVITASQEHRFIDIDSIDLGDATKWKIAFLYSDYKLLNTFNRDMVLSICDELNIAYGTNEEISSLSQKILAQKPQPDDYFEFGSSFWARPLVSQDLKKSLVKNQAYLDGYFKVVDILIEEFKLEPGDPRYYFSYEKNQLIFTIGQRYIWNVDSGLFKYISQDKIEDRVEEFVSGKKGEAYLNYTSVFPSIDVLYNRVKHAVQIELSRTSISGFRKYNKADFERLVFDKDYRNNYFNRILKIDIYEPSCSKTIIDQSEPAKMAIKSLNQILYGPPGTGKTYNTINKAVAIVNPSFNLNQDRAIIKAEYQRLVDAGLIVFTTFHQSMSYEDFVEGIKPVIDEDSDGNKQVVYEVQDGIFKKIVEDAKKVKVVNSEEKEVYDFDDAWNELIENVREQVYDAMNDFHLDILTPNKMLNVTEITDKGNLRIKPESLDSLTYTVSYARTQKLHEVFPDLSVVKNIDKEFRSVIGGSNSTTYWAVLNYINKKISERKSLSNISVELPKENHVLIIDEINRGNVSAIFGELITLIEDSKREGKDDALVVRLPYSKDRFLVPSNLYIIGTMNTADRSVEALDTALRRRFVFEEMLPNTSVLKEDLYGYPASDILNKINIRIEKLIDRDHCIGHAYFIGKDEITIIDSFYKNIIPLLQEYFFGDYGKMGLVLGKGFVRLKKEEDNIFADFDYDYVDDLKSKPIYEIIDYRRNKEEGLSFEKALQDLMR